MSDRSADFLAEIEATATVTVPLRDLRRLIDAVMDGAASQPNRSRPRFAKAPRSPIDADPEIATFIMERLGRKSVRLIIAECRETFGQHRTPSHSAIGRFWTRLREGTK